MPINIQNWTPATCGCTIQEAWDTDADPATRIHTMVGIITRGSEHAAIVDASLYSVLKEESKRQERSENEIKSRVSAAVFAGVTWAFDPGRTLTITFLQASVPASTVAAIQEWCDINLGIGKVIIVA